MGSATIPYTAMSPQRCNRRVDLVAHPAARLGDAGHQCLRWEHDLHQISLGEPAGSHPTWGLRLTAHHCVLRAQFPSTGLCVPQLAADRPDLTFGLDRGGLPDHPDGVGNISSERTHSLIDYWYIGRNVGQTVPLTLCIGLITLSE